MESDPDVTDLVVGANRHDRADHLLALQIARPTSLRAPRGLIASVEKTEARDPLRQGLGLDDLRVDLSIREARSRIGIGLGDLDTSAERESESDGN